MCRNRDVSAKGYYYNLDISPYEWTSPYGDVYRMPSRKRAEMMDARVAEETERLHKYLDRSNLRGVIQPEIVTLLHKTLIQIVYDTIIGR